MPKAPMPKVFDSRYVPITTGFSISGATSFFPPPLAALAAKESIHRMKKSLRVRLPWHMSPMFWRFLDAAWTRGCVRRGGA